MCIKKVEAFLVDDKLYADELTAVEARIQQIGKALLKSSEGAMFTGLVSHGKELGELADRRITLLADKMPSENDQRDPPLKTYGECPGCGFEQDGCECQS
jgi:hypothetical protein